MIQSGGWSIICFSPWVVLIFLLFACFGRLEVCFVAYFVALVHEAGHLIVAKILGYNPLRVEITPCGVCLKLNKRISNNFHEFLISIAGPFVNFIMITLATVLTYIEIAIPKAFFIANFYMLFINLLPVLPLDGGRIIISILKKEMADKKAQKLLNYISVPVICILAVFGVVLLFKSKINASLLIASVFMCNNIKIAGNKSLDIVSLYDLQISCSTAKVYYINENMHVKEAIKKLPFEDLVVIFVVSDSGETVKTITNKYILSLNNDDYLNCKISDI